MDNLFGNLFASEQKQTKPLADRMRPERLSDFVGQESAVGVGSPLRRMIERDALQSVLFYGPPGTGKTTLAQVIAHVTGEKFVSINAVSSGVPELRKLIAKAQDDRRAGMGRTIVFIDEIHRFSRSQQDALLHAVEDRTVVMIGATTENPYFEVNSALLSRGRVVEFEHLTNDDIARIIRHALSSPKGLDGAFSAQDDVVEAICMLAAGDARSALTTLELASEVALMSDRGEKREDGAPMPLPITLEDVKVANPRRGFAYDKDGDMHYDIISAFIKSMRGSDPDATVYWLARMIDAGEDPKFIARRIMIQASEDVGNADPQAFLIAEAAFKSAEVIGYPECRINLAQAALYVALAPKSNACEAAIDAALADVHSSGLREVPSYLRDRHRPNSDSYGPYLYPHDYPEGWVDQRYLPEGLERGAFWKPDGRGWEQWRFEQSERDRTGRAPEVSDSAE